MKNTLKVRSFDDMVDALADVQRRKLLVALLEHNPQDDAPVVIAGSESESDAVERLVTMQHVHLPKLADYGFIEWNRETHEVAKGPKFDEIRPLLELLENHEDELPADWL
ncbi:transcriptional regulator [Haloarculaceae archaeon H-GB2-1]|nr:transcriptional regulator [Haloarculaceae archaeon H-GB1-1]MEA5409554.1 transcriptional regulator [Haloarculaceae archaeon H-GB2-1]